MILKQFEIGPDKIGHYYKNRKGDIVKIIYILEQNESYPVVAIIRDIEVIFQYTKKGCYYSEDELKNLDLVEYLGPDLPKIKKPREFEFEAYMTEFPHQEPVLNSTIDEEIGHACGDLKSTASSSAKFESKWLVTMKEIFE